MPRKYEKREIVILLDNIRSLHNVGSVFRTADAAGVSKIYLCGITPSPQDRFGNVREQLSKVSLGAEQTVPWEAKQSTTAAIQELKKGGFIVFAVEQDKNSVPYNSVNAGNKIALVFGNEVEGLPVAILKEVDEILEIPMVGKKESLNVSVAAGIIIFSVMHNSRDFR